MQTTSPLVDFFEYCRPRAFAEIAGNDHIKRQIRRMVTGFGIPKAVLIHAPIGIGKTSIARLLACTSFCESRSDGEIEPCGSCEPCRKYLRRGSGLCFDKVLYYENCANVTFDVVRRHQNWMNHQSETVFIYDEFHRATWRLQDSLLTWIESGQDFRLIICTTELKDDDVHTQALAHRCHLLRPTAPTTDELVERLRAICVRLADDMPGLQVEDSALRELCLRYGANPRATLNALRCLLFQDDG